MPSKVKHETISKIPQVCYPENPIPSNIQLHNRKYHG